MHLRWILPFFKLHTAAVAAAKHSLFPVVWRSIQPASLPVTYSQPQSQQSEHTLPKKRKSRNPLSLPACSSVSVSSFPPFPDSILLRRATRTCVPSAFRGLSNNRSVIVEGARFSFKLPFSTSDSKHNKVLCFWSSNSKSREATFLPFPLPLVKSFKGTSSRIQGHQRQQQRHLPSGKMAEQTSALSIAYDPNNVFKKILNKQLPCFKVFETDHVIAILDAFPAVEGHCLLIPKKEVSSILDMDAETAAQLFRELPRLCRAVQQATKCDGVTVLQNNGKPAGQEVFHAHVHVLPRFSTDRFSSYFVPGKKMIDSTAAKSILEKIQAHI